MKKTVCDLTAAFHAGPWRKLGIEGNPSRGPLMIRFTVHVK